VSDDPLPIVHIGEHDYLVRLTEGEDEVEFRIRAAPATVARLGFQPDQEPQVVAATAAFLTRHQLAADLPDLVELDDVLAVYDDYAEELTSRLS
jgi:hypothetical protein